MPCKGSWSRSYLRKTLQSHTNHQSFTRKHVINTARTQLQTYQKKHLNAASRHELTLLFHNAKAFDRQSTSKYVIVLG